MRAKAATKRAPLLISALLLLNGARVLACERKRIALFIGATPLLLLLVLLLVPMLVLLVLVH